MSSRPIISPYKVITNGDMTQTLSSIVTIIQMVSKPSYSVSWSGASPVGTLSVQVSNDYSKNAAGNVLNTGTWTTISFSYNGTIVSSIPVSGNTGNGFIDIQSLSSYAVRLVYTPTSGTGQLQAYIAGKVA